MGTRLMFSRDVTTQNGTYAAKTVGSSSQWGGIMFNDKVPPNLNNLLAMQALGPKLILT